MELGNMTAVELRDLDEKIKIEIKSRAKHDLSKAREQILAIAQNAGIALKDLIAVAPVRAKTGSVPVRFRNPADASQQWTGRGRQPKWVKAWVDGGQSIDLLRV